MQTEKIASRYLTTKAMLIIRILVGGYLLYTAYSLIEGLKVTQGGELVFLAAAMIAFVIFGVCFILFSLKSLKIGKYKGGAMDAGEDAEEAAGTDSPIEPEKVEFIEEEKDMENKE